MLKETYEGSVILLVLLYLSMAFDTIDHGILLDQLLGLGIGGTAFHWLQSFLNDWCWMVQVGDAVSSP